MEKVLHVPVTSRDSSYKRTKLLHEGRTEKKTATLSVPFYLITCWKMFLRLKNNPHFYSDLLLRL